MGGEGSTAESAWAPLSHPVFRALWIASLVSNIGTWMQNVGAAWAMTSLSPSPLMVALVQSATSLPVFVVGLPAGAVADIVDRRRLLLVTQTWMLAAAALLAVLAFVDLMTPTTLLVLTFALGIRVAPSGAACPASRSARDRRHARRATLRAPRPAARRRARSNRRLHRVRQRVLGLATCDRAPGPRPQCPGLRSAAHLLRLRGCRWRRPFAAGEAPFPRRPRRPPRHRSL